MGGSTLTAERKKTEQANEGWEKDRAPTCTSRILEGRSGDTGERERGGDTEGGWAGLTHTTGSQGFLSRTAL